MNTNRRHTWAVTVPNPSLLGTPTKELVTAADCYTSYGVLQFVDPASENGQPQRLLAVRGFAPGQWLDYKIQPSEESEEIGGVVVATVIEAFGRRSG